MRPRVAIVVFPGSNCEQDVLQALDYLGVHAEYVWHHATDLGGFDAAVLPGGFSYGDYLRTGAIAAFSPVMAAIRELAEAGGLVIGICNGFQSLCEAGLLPGALRWNAGLRFICRPVGVRIETTDSPFTERGEPGRVLQIPINHFQGNYYCSPEVLAQLTAEDRIAFRYVDNPNGSVGDIAGILSEGRNVLGMMPHPERAVDPAVGGTDGQLVWKSMLAALGAGTRR